jgi:hypothetical protein
MRLNPDGTINNLGNFMSVTSAVADAQFPLRPAPAGLMRVKQAIVLVACSLNLFLILQNSSDANQITVVRLN